MPKIPRQRGAAAIARTGLQSGHLPALHRLARSHGRLVPHQPAAEADQDRHPRRASRSSNHLPIGRAVRHRLDGPRHPRRDPPPSSASVMCMTAIHAQTERKLQERFARCAEKHHRRARTRRLRGLIRSVPAVARAAGDAQAGKGLPNDPV